MDSFRLLVSVSVLSMALVAGSIVFRISVHDTVLYHEYTHMSPFFDVVAYGGFLIHRPMVVRRDSAVVYRSTILSNARIKCNTQMRAIPHRT
jgi:hypothetical protein